MRELVPRACVQLRAEELPVAWATVEAAVSPRCTARVPQMRSLVETLRAEVPEFRRAQALGYPVAGVLALLALALFSGVGRGPTDLADYAATLSQGQLRALRFRCFPSTRRVRCPERATFERVSVARAAGWARSVWPKRAMKSPPRGCYWTSWT